MRPLVFAMLALSTALPVSGQDSPRPESRADTLGTVHVVTGLRTAPVVLLDLGRADVRIRTGEAGTVRAWVRPLPGAPSSKPVPAQLVFVQEVDGVVRVSAGPEGRSHGLVLTLEVPPGVELQATLLRGDIAVRGVTGMLDLSTSRGDVRLDDIGGSVLVDIRNGNVQASFQFLHPELPSAFATLNGNVDLTLPANAAAELDVRCRGCTLRRVPQSAQLRRTALLDADMSEPVLSLYGPLGGGGAALRVFTWNGEVAVTAR